MANAAAGVVAARALGPSGLGELAIAVLWSALVHTAITFGMPASLTYHLAKWPTRRMALVRWLPPTVRSQLVGIFVVTAVVLGGYWHFHRVPLLLVLEFSCWGVIAGLLLYATGYSQGMGDFRRYNTLRILSAAAPSVLILLAALLVHLTVVEVGATYLLGLSASAVLAAVWARDTHRDKPREPISNEEGRALWSYARRSFGNQTSLTMNRRADQFGISTILSSSSLGYYSVAASASGVVEPIVSALAVVRLPAVAGACGPERRRLARRTLLHGAAATAVTTPCVGLALLWALPTFYGAAFIPALMPAEILLVGSAMAALTTVVDSLLSAYGRPGVVSISQGIGGAITLAGTVAVASFGLSAIATASTIGFAISLAIALERLYAVMRLDNAS